LNAANPRLLIVDDIAENRNILARRFAKRGHEIVESDNGLAALDLIEQQHFDLVLLDIMMPGIDGIEVLKRIRVKHSLDSLPVIMVTGKAFGNDIVGALELGANDYLVKPVDFAVAFARVQSQLARRQAQQALVRSNNELLEANRQLEKEISERKRSNAQIHYITNYDTLTGLGNRVLLREQLTRALRRAVQHSGSLGVLLLRVDNFKLLNAALGRLVGDALLKSIADRLLASIGEADLVARVGDDEFAVIHNTLMKPEDAGRLAHKLVQTVAVPSEIDGKAVVLHSSVGIALAPNDGSDPDVILRSAHLALHGTKADGHSSYRFFEEDMNARAQARQALESDLRKALAAGELEPFYQPLFDLAGSEISGFEALLRWNHRERGMISPAEFIPLAEEIGLIVPLGEWLLMQACADAASWPEDARLAVNISPVQFRCEGLIQAVTAALAASGLPANRLELEITETSLLSNNAIVLGTLNHLRCLGVRISLDDFGTGYSSLNYLRTFPFNKIKIDQSFIREFATDPGTTAIVRAITSLAKDLGMTTTAEGVETQEQLEWLKAEGCTEVQGYLISRPMPAKDVQSFMMRGHLAWKAA
jgi:diguanylate cyclase (GGDEF)-like protein